MEVMQLTKTAFRTPRKRRDGCDAAAATRGIGAAVVAEASSSDVSTKLTTAGTTKLSTTTTTAGTTKLTSGKPTPRCLQHFAAPRLPADTFQSG